MAPTDRSWTACGPAGTLQTAAEASTGRSWTACGGTLQTAASTLQTAAGASTGLSPSGPPRAASGMKPPGVLALLKKGCAGTRLDGLYRSFNQARYNEDGLGELANRTDIGETVGGLFWWFRLRPVFSANLEALTAELLRPARLGKTALAREALEPASSVEAGAFSRTPCVPEIEPRMFDAAAEMKWPLTTELPVAVSALRGSRADKGLSAAGSTPQLRLLTDGMTEDAAKGSMECIQIWDTYSGSMCVAQTWQDVVQTRAKHGVRLRVVMLQEYLTAMDKHFPPVARETIAQRDLMLKSEDLFRAGRAGTGAGAGTGGAAENGAGAGPARRRTSSSSFKEPELEPELEPLEPELEPKPTESFDVLAACLPISDEAVLSHWRQRVNAAEDPVAETERCLQMMGSLRAQAYVAEDDSRWEFVAEDDVIVWSEDSQGTADQTIASALLQQFLGNTPI